jgi:hypothetical protein
MHIVQCPECDAPIKLLNAGTSGRVSCPSCGFAFPVVVKDAPNAKRKLVKVAPTKPHSIYAWFVGLPLGILLISVALLILVPLSYVSYQVYSHHIKEAEREKEAKRQAEYASQVRIEEELRDREARRQLEMREVEARQRQIAEQQRQQKEQQEIERRRIEVAAEEAAAQRKAKEEEDARAREATRQRAAVRLEEVKQSVEKGKAAGAAKNHAEALRRFQSAVRDCEEIAAIAVGSPTALEATALVKEVVPLREKARVALEDAAKAEAAEKARKKAAERREAQAKVRLMSAERLTSDDSQLERIARLRELVKEFPGTASAAKAERILEEMKRAAKDK